jgi:hypothetical protein
MEHTTVTTVRNFQLILQNLAEWMLKFASGILLHTQFCMAIQLKKV